MREFLERKTCVEIMNKKCLSIANHQGFVSHVVSVQVSNMVELIFEKHAWPNAEFGSWPYRPQFFFTIIQTSVNSIYVILLVNFNIVIG